MGETKEKKKRREIQSYNSNTLLSYRFLIDKRLITVGLFHRNSWAYTFNMLCCWFR